MLKKLALSLSVFMLWTILISCGGNSKQTGQGFEIFDIKGTLHRSDEWIGKQPVVLNFWGTWCGPCRKEMPDLVRLYDEYSPKGIEMLGMAVNDHPNRIEKFVSQYGMRWVMLMANRDIAMRYGVTSGIPQTIFLDKDARVVMRFRGSRTYETLKTGFEALLKDQAK